MCVTKEDVEAIAKQVFHQEITEYLPTVIGKGIKEAGAHLQMSPETAIRMKRLEEQAAMAEKQAAVFVETFKKINESLDDNARWHKEVNEFREDIHPLLEKVGKMWPILEEVSKMRPILDSIKETSDGRLFVLNEIKKTAVVVGSLSVIFGAIYAIKEWIMR